MLRFGLTIAAVVAAADQISKPFLIDAVTGAGGVIDVLPFFRLVLVWNRGISFGVLGGAALPPALLAAVAAALCLALGVWLARTDDRLIAASLGLIIGGAVGNIADRLGRGAVADFFDLFVGAYHWPAFNIADAAVTVGVVLLLGEPLLRRRDRRK